jgi:hypothetical protein
MEPIISGLISGVIIAIAFKIYLKVTKQEIRKIDSK